MKTVVSTSNALTFKASKTVGGVDILVKIQLTDECKNGHEDFSITGDTYEAGKRGDRAHISGGCIHEEIEKHFPEFIPFIRLHLCDHKGVPMHAGGNMFYHLEHGFNRTKVSDPKFKDEFCEYYRVTPEQFDVLRTCEGKNVLLYRLETLGVFDQWEKEAKAAIKQLEKLTGQKFASTAGVRNERLNKEEVKAMEERMNAGYYNPEQIQARKSIAAADTRIKQVQEVQNEYSKSCKKAKAEMDVKIAILSFGLTLSNFIYYTHTNRGVFNWKSYESKITAEELAAFMQWVTDTAPQLPEGVTFSIEHK